MPSRDVSTRFDSVTWQFHFQEEIMKFVHRRWTKLEWKSPNDCPEDLAEILQHGSIRWFQGLESANVYKLESAIGSYGWYIFDIHNEK